MHTWLLARAFGGTGALLLPRSIGAFAVAFSIGFIIIIAPAGGGPREAALTTAFSGVLPAGAPLALALVSRLLLTIADLAGGGVGRAAGAARPRCASWCIVHRRSGWPRVIPSLRRPRGHFRALRPPSVGSIPPDLGGLTLSRFIPVCSAPGSLPCPSSPPLRWRLLPSWAPLLSASASPAHTHHRTRAVCSKPIRHFAGCNAVALVDGSGQSADFRCPAGDSRRLTSRAPMGLPSVGRGPVGWWRSSTPMTTRTRRPIWRSNRAHYGLPATTLLKVGQTGTSTLPAANSGWAEEESLDLDAVSAVCPGCSIALVEASSSSIGGPAHG